MARVCPQCGCHARRSHAKGLRERLIRTFTPLRIYRCHDCGWRGWLAEAKSSAPSVGRKKKLQTFLAFLIALLLTIIAAFYFAR